MWQSGEWSTVLSDYFSWFLDNHTKGKGSVKGVRERGKGKR